MKYVNDADKAEEDIHIKETLFDRVGGTIMNKNEKVFAKVMATTRRNAQSKAYYVKVHRGVPYDPWGMHSHRETYLEATLKKVTKETFDYYMMFLKTRNLLYMTRAGRSFIDD